MSEYRPITQTVVYSEGVRYLTDAGELHIKFDLREWVWIPADERATSKRGLWEGWPKATDWKPELGRAIIRDATGSDAFTLYARNAPDGAGSGLVRPWISLIIGSNFD